MFYRTSPLTNFLTGKYLQKQDSILSNIILHNLCQCVRNLNPNLNGLRKILRKWCSKKFHRIGPGTLFFVNYANIFQLFQRNLRQNWHNLNEYWLKLAKTSVEFFFFSFCSEFKCFNDYAMMTQLIFHILKADEMRHLVHFLTNKLACFSPLDPTALVHYIFIRLGAYTTWIRPVIGFQTLD